ncbi:S-adenosyl-L-methionine-dependent methyltransferase [Aspergillus karnatakaensis]|uniref:class I SAM-dependent DNA methyltransferase n=1 Tax=Aspergillus karnatakaensis TaxID=1810916 RepID=UPI003CCD2770
MAQTIQDALAKGGKASTSEGRSVEYVGTVEAYNKWAEVYDTDGNFLQALDTIQMKDLLPRFLSLVQSQNQTKSLKLVDLGCGTGRNTLQLVKAAPEDAQIIGVDASPGMLEVARETLSSNGVGERVSLGVYDLLAEADATLPESLGGESATGIISTLVLEHIPLDQFFGNAARLIKPGGFFLVTNMHAEMGGISQAGFVDVQTGKKIRPTSYAHEVKDVVTAAENFGFEVVALNGEKVKERKVDEAMLKDLGGRAKKWVGVMVWFGVCFKMTSA